MEPIAPDYHAIASLFRVTAQESRHLYQGIHGGFGRSHGGNPVAATVNSTLFQLHQNFDETQSFIFLHLTETASGRAAVMETRVTAEMLRCPDILMSLDLELGLSMPPPPPQSSASMASLPPSSSMTHEEIDVAQLFDYAETPESPSEADSLIAMGCTFCHMYVMVSRANPRCPTCNSTSFLLDMFRSTP